MVLSSPPPPCSWINYNQCAGFFFCPNLYHLDNNLDDLKNNCPQEKEKDLIFFFVSAALLSQQRVKGRWEEDGTVQIRGREEKGDVEEEEYEDGEPFPKRE